VTTKETVLYRRHLVLLTILVREGDDRAPILRRRGVRRRRDRRDRVAVFKSGSGQILSAEFCRQRADGTLSLAVANVIKLFAAVSYDFSQ
jgi:hypothetical protein